MVGWWVVAMWQWWGCGRGGEEEDEKIDDEEYDADLCLCM